MVFVRGGEVFTPPPISCPFLTTDYSFHINYNMLC